MTVAGVLGTNLFELRKKSCEHQSRNPNFPTDPLGFPMSPRGNEAAPADNHVIFIKTAIGSFCKESKVRLVNFSSSFILIRSKSRGFRGF